MSGNGGHEPGPEASQPRVAVRRVTRADRDELIALARASTELHHPWIWLPVRPAEFEDYIARFDQPAAIGLLVCERQAGAIAGQVNINNIVRGNFQCGALGYAAFAPLAGRGYMSEGLRLVLGLAFGELGLHRLEANIQPGNEASRRLVRRLGFRQEGYSPAFLRVGGSWQDHERWAITSEMLASPAPAWPRRRSCSG